MQKDRNKLKKELLSKKEPVLDDLEDSSPIQIALTGNRARGLAGQPFAKEIRCVIHGFNQSLKRS